MEIFVLGTNQSVASTCVRERMHVDLDEVHEALQHLLIERRILAEAVPLATCGRLEVYGLADDVDGAVRVLERLMMQRTEISRLELARHAYLHRGGDAVRHLFRVAAGLDSVIHGEAQILGQVRNAAYHPAAEAMKGPILHRLFQDALTTGKRVRSETGIGRGAASLAGASLTMLQEEIGDLQQLSVLVMGAGDTGSLMARLLAKSGVGRLIIANRTLARAQDVAADLGAEACRLDDVPELLGGVDIVVGAATTKNRLVTPATLGDRGGMPTPRCFLDLAHPRNFDPALADLPGVTLLDLEHVFVRVEAARRSRAAQVPVAEGLVEEHAGAFLSWVRSRENVTVVKAVRSHVMDHARAEAERYAESVPEEYRDQMRRLARSVARTLLHGPTMALREADPLTEEGRYLLTHAPALFGLGQPVRDRSSGT